MPGEWDTFYLMVGSSAAALIGLLFVVITLATEIDASKVNAAQRTFMTPTVFHFVTVVIISAAAVAPVLPPAVMASAIVVPSAVGLAYGTAAVLRLESGRLAATHWTDYLFYGLLPIAGYLWLIGSGIGIWQDTGWADYSVALALMALLLLGIRDAWDLATWLTYHRKG